MRAEELIVTIEALATLADPLPPLAIVDLARTAWQAIEGPPPPCPVIGLGAADHPASCWFDAIVEAPIGQEALAATITHAPHAAAALVHLLRIGGGLDRAAALAAESLCYAMLQGSAEHRAWQAGRPKPSSLPSGALRLDRRGDMLDLVLDRPEAHNAIDRAMRDALHEAFTLAALDRDIARVRLGARGRAFCMGADLAEFGTTTDPATAHLIRMQTLPALPLLACADRLEVHVAGGCVGAGLELAAFARRLTAGSRAWFQLPELAMGIIPGAGGTVSIPRRIGRHRAALLMLSGRRIDAATALRWGLIDAIVDAPPADEYGTDAL